MRDLGDVHGERLRRHAAWALPCLLVALVPAPLGGCIESPVQGDDEASGGVPGGGGSGGGGVAGVSSGVGGPGAGGATAGGAGASGTGGGGGRAGIGGASGAAGGSAGGAGSAGGSAGTGGAGGAAGNSGAAGEGGEGGAGGSTSIPGASCSGGDYLICEDFEAAPVGGTPNGWSKHGDDSGVVDDMAFGGERSLRLGAIPVWERRIYHDASALGSAHWGRIYFRVQLPVPNAFVHSTLVALSGEGPTRGASEYRVVDTVKQAENTPDVGSRIQFLWNVQPQNSGEFGEGTSYDREFDDEWHCAEWHLDASDQSYAFYLDGEELIAFENGAGNFDGTDMPDSFDELRIGWINYQDSPPGFTAYLDDVALDDERIGCL